jgi:hypothetical protein
MLRNHANRIGVLGRAAAAMRRVNEMYNAYPARGTECETPGGTGATISGSLLLRNLNLTSVPQTVQ